MDSATPFRLPAGQSLVVTGSLSAKPQDRSLDRTEIRSVQIVDQRGARSAPWFDDRGELGVSSFVFAPDADVVLFSTGDDLLELCLGTGELSTRPVPDLVDVHEMVVVDGVVWLANTGRDELVSVPLAGTGPEGERLSLASFRVDEAEGSDAVDRFHVNQAFADRSGSLHCLVHHVAGRQFLRRVAARVVKSQGDGGVLDLATGHRRGLGLSAPHSVRIVGDRYWVFDSGRATIGVFDDDWRSDGTIATSGWGRGAAVSDDGATVYAGMSPVRKRYLPFMSGQALTVPAVEAFDTAARRSLGVLELDHVEQVNNVYLVPDATAEALVAL
jgi:Domain of unknown function (DUF4915)